MKLLLPSLLLLLGALGALAAPHLPAEAEGGAHNPPPYYALANYLQQQKRAEASALEKELLAEYLASQMGSPDYPEPEESRMKRWWGGNKYKDNKSYGFWSLLLTRLATSRGAKDQHFYLPWELLWMTITLLQDHLTIPMLLNWFPITRLPFQCISRSFTLDDNAKVFFLQFQSRLL